MKKLYYDHLNATPIQHPLYRVDSNGLYYSYMGMSDSGVPLYVHYSVHGTTITSDGSGLEEVVVNDAAEQDQMEKILLNNKS